MKRIILFITLLALTSVFIRPASATTLPEADWYAVVWQTETDTLHWINANGEQASIARPKLEDEDPQGQHWVRFSRNGQSLIVGAKLMDGRYAVGFYDLEQGQFYVQHKAASGEVIVPPSEFASNFTSKRFALGMYTPGTSQYRVMNFELPTGNALTQLTSDDAGAPILPDNSVPYLFMYGLDEGLGQNVVHLQFVSVQPQSQYPAYQWYPELPEMQVSTSSYTFHNMDIDLPAEQIVYAINDDTIAKQTVPTPFSPVYSEAGAELSAPQFLKGGLWVGFRRISGAFTPHWAITYMNKSEGDPPDTEMMVLGPNIDALAGTPDGYLAIDREAGTIHHMTEYVIEAFTPTVGNQVFSTDPGYFTVVYVTPHANNFELAAVGEPVVAVDVPGDVAQQPSDCSGVVAPRLTVGQHARVSFTNGQALNVRDAANGSRINSIPEGTEFDVLTGPTCAGDHNWYQIRTTAGLVGWSAEGDGDTYFVEPFNPAPSDIAAVPTATPMIIVTEICNLAPTSRLSVGVTAITSTSGTLAMRTELTDEFPSNQVPDNQRVTVKEGPRCREGYRMWKVNVTLKGQVVSGWLSEGTQQRYFLIPTRGTRS
jgi:hypothetical protein